MEQKPYRILQVGMSDNYGGTEAIIYGIYEHLDHSKIQFDFLNVYGHPIAWQDELIAQGAHIYHLLLKRREGYFKYIRGIKEFYKKHAKEFDAVVCNVQCLDQIDMAKYAKKFGIKKTVVHVHNSGNGIEASRLADLAIRMNKAHCHRYVDLFLACSKNAAKWGFRKQDASKAIIVNNGLDISSMSFSVTKRQVFRETYHFSKEDRIYASAGRLDPQKNQFFLIDIFEHIHQKEPQAKFVLLGNGPLRDQMQSRIDDSSAKGSMLLLNRIDDIGTFYSGIDVFVLPSLFEGLGMVLLEAQCSGLPCYASAGTIPEEACVLKNFRFIPLNLGSEGWASQILNDQLAFSNRAEAAKFLVKAGRDICDTSRFYSSLFLGDQL
jgi:glycosyltransferase involved in cell wall biosynthesis